MKSSYLLVISFFIFGTCVQSQEMSYWERAKGYFRSTPKTSIVKSDLSNSEQIEKEFNDLVLQLQKIFDEKNYSSASSIIKRLHEISSSPSSSDRINERQWQNVVHNTWKYVLKIDQQQVPAFINMVIIPTLSLFRKNHFSRQLFEILELNISSKLIEKYKQTLLNLLLWGAQHLDFNNELNYTANYVLLKFLRTSKFEDALILFKAFYPLTHSVQGIENIIITTDDFNNFLRLFLKPAFEFAPSFYNEIFNAITINYFSKKYPTYDIQQIINENIDKFSYDLTLFRALYFLIQISKKNESTTDQKILRIFIENGFPEQLIILAKLLLTDIHNSPTGSHLKRYFDSVIRTTEFKQFQENKELKDLYIKFVNKEQELNKRGYYTFVHGQMRSFYLPESLYTHLWSLRKKQSVDNFFFAHIKDLIETSEAQFEEDIMRRTIHMVGTAGYNQSRKHILFMNYAFFANTDNKASNSASFVIDNLNAQRMEISIKEPFTLLGYDWIYKKHKQEIEQLAKDYVTLSDYGNILLIAIPKDKVYKYVYLCGIGGLQQPLIKKDGIKITDIRIAMETLLKHPEELKDSDQIEFCLIMTQQKGGLDPSTGIQIYPLLSGDPEKLKALQAREKILLDKITADVKEAEKQQALQRAAKITEHVVESAEAK